ncbi:MAG: transcriptional regulator [Actinomycetota bacterium]|nr:transcriptional regulator [Actinomycetota bacterium]
MLSLPVDEWTGSDAAEFADRLTRGDTPVTATTARRIVHEWLVAEPPQTVEVTAGRRIGAGMVDTVTRRVAQLRQVDDFIGGRELRPLVEREVRSTARLLRDAAYTDPAGRALLGAVAELCQLAGWVTADAGDPDQAVRYHLLGVHAAHAAGDRPTAANLVSTLSYQVANFGDPHEAVLLARSAASGAGGHASATTRALLGERVAWAHARAHDTRHAERALAAVEAEYERRRPADDPDWVYWLDEDEITVMAGRCYVELGRPARAIPRLAGVLDRYDARQARESALYTSSTSSSRGDDRVALLRRLLQPHAAVPEVRTFLDRDEVARSSA